MSRWGGVAGELLLLVARGPADRGQAPHVSESLPREDPEVLTSDAGGRRGMTTKGIQLAAEHIAAEFRKAGLKPGAPDGTYFQTFKVVPGFRVEPKGAPLAELSLSGPLGQTIVLKLGSDFTLNGRSGTAT